MAESEKKMGRGQHPNSRANLEAHKFKPGQPSPNPAGRPRQVATRLIREIGAQRVEGGAEGETRLRRVINKLFEMAEAGDREAARLLIERVEGRPRQSISVTTGARERIERAIDNLVETARERGDALSRRDAHALLAEYDDEAAALLEEEE